jgi:hypothetical protein
MSFSTEDENDIINEITNKVLYLNDLLNRVFLGEIGHN